MTSAAIIICALFQVIYLMMRAKQSSVVPFAAGNGKSRPIIGLVSMSWGGSSSSEYAAELEAAEATHQSYAARHGYPRVKVDHSIYDMHWSEPALVLSTILSELQKPRASERLQWIVWTSSDTVIVNQDVPLEVLLPPSGFEHIHLLVTNDNFGLNKAVFFIKVDEVAVDFLSSVLAYRTYNADKALTLADQSAMQEVLQKNKFKRAAQFVPQHWFNGYPTGVLEGQVSQPGDVIMHLPSHRKASVLHVIEAAQQNASFVGTTQANLHLLDEIHSFWESQPN
jgi:hypothetical protein